ncbi:MAG: DUF1269 domain-containing protein [Acidimicrobiia bacterium]
MTDASPDAPTTATANAGEQHVVAVVFDDKSSRADEALLAIMHLQQEGTIQLADAVVVSKGEEGKTHVRQTVDVTPGRGAMGGAWLGTFVGLLFGGPLVAALAGAAGGALYGKLVDIGLDDGWVKQMAEWLDPGTSALLLLVADPVLPTAALRELNRFEGRMVSTTFPDTVRQAIEDALAPDDGPS